MRPWLPALALLGIVSALPAVDKVAIDDCCCCDLARNAIACTDGIPSDQCICPAVECPPNAHTIFLGVPPAPATTRRPAVEPAPSLPAPPKANPPASTPASPQTPWWWSLLASVSSPPQNDCCCCDPVFGVTTCRKQSAACSCLVPECPPGRPTIYPNGDGPKPTTTAAPVLPFQVPNFQANPAPSTTTQLSNLQPLRLSLPTTTLVKQPCCCCDISRNQIACQMKEPDQCICAMVMCPPAAPTVWPFGDKPVATSASKPSPTINPWWWLLLFG